MSKILHIRSSHFIGGPERQILGLLKNCGQYEHIVASFTVNGGDNKLLSVAGESGLRVWEIVIRNSFDPGCLGQIIRFCKREGIKIICTHDYRANVIVALCALFSPVVQIVFFRGWTGENRKVKGYELLDRIVLRFVDKVVALSARKMAEMKRFGINEQKVVIIHNSIDVSEVGKREFADIRHQYAVGKNKTIIGTVGRLSVEKGHRFLLEAAHKLCRKYDDVLFLIVGDGQEKQQLEEMATRLGLEENVIFTGWQDDPLSFIHSMDIFILPSLTEGLPNVLLEAAALSKPIVTTDVGGCGDIVTHEKTGLLIKAADSDQMHKALQTLLEKQQWREELGRQAYKKVKNEFSFTESVRRYEQLVGEYI